MNKTIYCLLFIYLAASVCAMGQGSAALTDAFKAGNADALGPLLSSRVEMSILGDQKLASPAQVRQMLSAFFSEYKPKNFSEMHQSRSRDKDTSFTISKLDTHKGTFRVYIYYEQRNANRLVRELRIEVFD